MTIFQDNGYCRGEILSLYPAESTDECLNQIIHFFWKKRENEFSVGKKSESEGFVFWAYLASVSKHEYNLRPTAAAVEEESASSTEEQTWWSPEKVERNERRQLKTIRTSENDIGWRFACFWQLRSLPETQTQRGVQVRRSEESDGMAWLPQVGLTMTRLNIATTMILRFTPFISWFFTYHVYIRIPFTHIIYLFCPRLWLSICQVTLF